MPKTARDMTPDCECSGENDSVLDAAKRLAELNVGAVPICGEDNRLKGMLSDRDIVAKPESSAPRASVGHNPPEDQADGSEQPARKRRDRGSALRFALEWRMHLDRFAGRPSRPRPASEP